MQERLAAQNGSSSKEAFGMGTGDMTFGPCTCDKPGHEVWCSAYDDGNMICSRCGFHLKSVEHNYCAVTNFNNSTPMNRDHGKFPKIKENSHGRTIFHPKN